MRWRMSHRAENAARIIADRHYNRQKVGAPQFVPPGRCLVLMGPTPALWVTSWPFAEYVQHGWAGAWMNSLFRNESGEQSSGLILEAIAATRWFFGDAPELGMVTFVDPAKVPGTPVRGERIYGYCYQRAGFRHVGFTQKGLWAWQLLGADMPPPEMPVGGQRELVA
jgi:hypothetical protein